VVHPEAADLKEVAQEEGPMGAETLFIGSLVIVVRGSPRSALMVLALGIGIHVTELLSV